jgi:hypothetical protein
LRCERLIVAVRAPNRCGARDRRSGQVPSPPALRPLPNLKTIPAGPRGTPGQRLPDQLAHSSSTTLQSRFAGPVRFDPPVHTTRAHAPAQSTAHASVPRPRSRAQRRAASLCGGLGATAESALKQATSPFFGRMRLWTASRCGAFHGVGDTRAGGEDGGGGACSRRGARCSDGGGAVGGVDGANGDADSHPQRAHRLGGPRG